MDSSHEGRLLVTTREAADRLSIGRSTVYELIQNGALPVVRIGRSVRIRLRDLEAWIDSRVEAD